MRRPETRRDSKPLNDILSNKNKDPSLELNRKISWVKQEMGNMKIEKVQHIRKSTNHVTNKLTNNVVTEKCRWLEAGTPIKFFLRRQIKRIFRL